MGFFGWVFFCQPWSLVFRSLVYTVITIHCLRIPILCGNPFRQSQCCGSGMFIPDSSIFHPGSEYFPSRILIFSIPEFRYFNPKKCFLSTQKYDPGFPYRIPDPDCLPVPDPGFKKATDPGSESANRWKRIAIVIPGTGM